MKLVTGSPRLLPALLRFWNRAFAGKRNYFPVDAALFRARVWRRPAYDPRRFVAAVEDGEVVGLLHAGVRSEERCRALDADWPGGRQGYVAFLYVDPAWRRKGIGDALWHRGLDGLKTTRQVTLDGQCLNPFYGNSEGPFTPFWGTPEGVSVEWNDSATKKWLARKGFAPRFKGVQLGLDLGAGPDVEEISRALARRSFSLRLLNGELPELGRPAMERRAILPGLDFECVQAVRRARTAGLVAAYPLKEVRSGLWAIYEAAVVEEQRGRMLGRRLLEALLARVRERGGSRIEVLTLPELSPGAFKLYTSLGFVPACAWAIY